MRPGPAQVCLRVPLDALAALVSRELLCPQRGRALRVAHVGHEEGAVRLEEVALLREREAARLRVQLVRHAGLPARGQGREEAANFGSARAASGIATTLPTGGAAAAAAAIGILGIPGKSQPRWTGIPEYLVCAFPRQRGIRGYRREAVRGATRRLGLLRSAPEYSILKTPRRDQRGGPAARQPGGTGHVPIPERVACAVGCWMGW